MFSHMFYNPVYVRSLDSPVLAFSLSIYRHPSTFIINNKIQSARFRLVSSSTEPLNDLALAAGSSPRSPDSSPFPYLEHEPSFQVNSVVKWFRQMIQIIQLDIRHTHLPGSITFLQPSDPKITHEVSHPSPPLSSCVTRHRSFTPPSEKN
jgi:hypothetical protein